MRATSPLIVAAGAATLFVELALIRYVPGQVRVLGYFTNFVLLAAFLGFGLGIMVRRRWPTSLWPAYSAPLALLAIVGLTEIGTELHVLPSPEHFLFIEHHTAGHTLPIYPFLALSFSLLAAGLLPLGHLVGQTVTGDRPLLRYALNILGSLLGIGCFVLLSAGVAPPWLWMLIAALFCCVALGHAPRKWQIIGLIATIATVAVAASATRDATWSPYQKLTLAPLRVLGGQRVIQEWELPRLNDEGRAAVHELPREAGFTVRVNDDSYQTPVDLSAESIKRYPGLKLMQRQYDLPFLVRPSFRGTVLVLGAGTGNDVAGALRAGATRVDAVEIDPEILKLGYQHPEKPYDNDKVHVHITDARSFLARTDRKFDMIVFGLLDSHVLASSRSTVRLDSFVFTHQSFALAAEHLADDGMLFVSHAVGTSWFFERMRATLAAAFGGKPPQVVTEQLQHPLGVVYASGPKVPAGRALSDKATILSDDWPFVYLKEHSIPRDYLVAIALVMLLSTLAVWLLARGMPADGDGQRKVSVNLHFFALGGGFLLLETRGLTVLALHLGSTWSVNSAVFAGVLAMALLSTWVATKLIARRGNGTLWWAYGVLAVALVLNFVIDLDVLSGIALGPRIVLGVALVSLPLFASGLVFAVSVDRLGTADRAMASNLLGAMAGGLLEYLAMVAGFRYLLVLAAVLYLVAMLGDGRVRSPESAA